MNYGDWLRVARARARMTQRALSKKSGVSEDTIVKIERGKRVARQSTRRKLEVVLATPQDNPDLQEAVKDFLALWYTPQGFSSSPEEHYANLHDAIERLREAVS